MKKDYKHLLGRNIKAERIRKNFTQEEFAEKINISLSHISKIEQGLTSPTAIVLYKMGLILDIKMEEFFKNISV